jgi:hypothetical protein
MPGRAATGASAVRAGGENGNEGVERKGASGRGKERDGPPFGGRKEKMQNDRKHKLTPRQRQPTYRLATSRKADQGKGVVPPIKVRDDRHQTPVRYRTGERPLYSLL